MTITCKARQGLALDDILVIDAHTHMGLWHNFHAPNNDAEGMIRSMDTLGIDKAVVTAHSSILPNYRYGNDLVANAVKAYPDRFLGYVTLNPHYPEDMELELKNFFDIPGFVGIKLHPSCHGVPIDYKNYEVAYRFADDTGCPVLIHVWGLGHVLTVKGLLDKYKNAKFIMGHGGADLEGMKLAIDLIGDYENAYIDTALSTAMQGNIEWLVENGGSKKILFGSDMPFYDPRHTFGRIAMAKISDDEKRDIFGLNMKKILEG